MAGFIPGPCISGVTGKEVGWRKDNSSQWEQGMTPPLIWASMNSCLPFIGLSWQDPGALCSHLPGHESWYMRPFEVLYALRATALCTMQHSHVLCSSCLAPLSALGFSSFLSQGLFEA